MKIAFYASNCVPFIDTTVDQGPLGGTESACIYMARSLAQLGCKITVYNGHPNGGVFRDIVYKPAGTLSQEAAYTSYDAFVAMRDWIPLLMPIQARLKYYWIGDSYDIFFNYGLGDKRVYDAIDRVITVSRWQAEMISKRSATPLEKFWPSRNGHWPDYFSKPVNRAPHSFIYTSTPYRGLDVLLDLFPKIKARYSESTLHLYSSLKVYNMGFSLKDSYPEIEKKIHQPGVISHESVNQQQLAQAIQAASLYLYPSTFEETSCIGAIETQAAGTPIVTSALAGLRETVTDGETGYLIEGNPTTSAYQEAFLNKTFELIDRPDTWQAFSSAGQLRAKSVYPWQTIAKEWLAFFEHQCREKS